VLVFSVNKTKGACERVVYSLCPHPQAVVVAVSLFLIDLFGTPSSMGNCAEYLAS